MISATNNPLESWHRSLNHCLNRQKPKLKNLILVLKDIEREKRNLQIDIISEKTQTKKRNFDLISRLNQNTESQIKIKKNVKRRPPTCSRCGNIGHRRDSKKCPFNN
ncbi:hypothetical protein M0813_06322 [Anaeramoeba flamelloides]|uniref:Zinc knuckle domain-containing protein n=1 Tax=Anaeramoeba flamelloides TaxID=1746091 RepID=A0ABQ8XGY2_9EUKA|nr:hypothetical protein M0813_06322 [Anaeramoeba flamelloides]